MNIVAPKLASGEREHARVLWCGLFYPSSMQELAVARENFERAPVSVQTAIGHFIALAWKEERNLREAVNPFA